MKSKIIAAFIAAVICIAGISFVSGCKASTDYSYNTDKDGNGYYVVKCSGFTGNLYGEYEIPEYYGEGEKRAPVTEIADKGFSSTNFNKVIIPKTVKKIGVAAFAYNYNLEEVVFSDGTELNEISRGAFAYCSLLKSVSIPSAVKKIGILAFESCSALDDITLPDGLEEIGSQAFGNCASLSEITLPQTLVTIGDKAFYYSGLKSIIIPDSVHDIITPVLDDNGNQTSDKDGNPATQTVYGIGVAAFHSCMSLEFAVVGKGVKTLPSGAFGYCSQLKKIYLPAELTGVGGAHYTDGKFYCGHAFHHDDNLEEVHFGGTEVQWSSLSSSIDNKKVVENNEPFDNSALFNAAKYYESFYTE